MSTYTVKYGERRVRSRNPCAGWELRLHEKGDRHHVVACHHALNDARQDYIDTAGIAEDRKGHLFRMSRGHAGTAL
jgi:hypothetical protein